MFVVVKTGVAAGRDTILKHLRKLPHAHILLVHFLLLAADSVHSVWRGPVVAFRSVCMGVGDCVYVCGAAVCVVSVLAQSL